MKKIWTLLVGHVREDFNKKQYAFVFAIIAIVLWVNYSLNFDDVVLRRQVGLTKFVSYFLFFSVPYYLVLIPIHRASKNKFLSDKSFWAKSVVGLSALSLDSSVPYLRESVMILVHPDVQLWAYKVIVNLLGLFTIVLPLYIIYTKYDKGKTGFYGLYPKRFDARPYFQMLLIMLPILIAASFLPSFLKQYPMYRTSVAHDVLRIPEWLTVLIYELAYGLDFITVEFLFRGFMVIGLSQFLGRHAVLPMAMIYCFLHTGKPLGEAMSSIFGGYLLGVIAYETKSIWGGVIVHMGIAWMMEAIGFGQKAL